MILYYTILYYTILYYTILYYTLLYYTIVALAYSPPRPTTPDAAVDEVGFPNLFQKCRSLPHLCQRPRHGHAPMRNKQIPAQVRPDAGFCASESPTLPALKESLAILGSHHFQDHTIDYQTIIFVGSSLRVLKRTYRQPLLTVLLAEAEPWPDPVGLREVDRLAVVAQGQSPDGPDLAA